MDDKILRFMSEYAEVTLYDAEKETNPTISREKYLKYDGMRELINAVIDETSNK
jgi:hypothetical protein